MFDGKKPERCIPRGELGAVLLRALRGARAAEAPGGRGPTGEPEDLFLKSEPEIKAHLEVCAMCQEEYEELKTFIEAYERKMDSIESDERFDVVSGWVLLVYKPYSRPFEERVSLAAATEPLEAENLRFCSADGSYLLKTYPDCETGHPVYYLIGETGNETAGVEIFIDGSSFRTDEEGKIEAGPGEIEITSGSRIFIKRGLRN